MTDYQQSTRTLFYGLLAIFVIMTGLACGSLFYMSSLNENTHNIASQNNVKSMLAVQMRDAIRKRQVSIRDLFLENDIFKREEMRLEFYDVGIEFSAAREKLNAMALSDDERSVFTQIIGATRIAYELQNSLVDLALQHTDPAVVRVKMREALDAQTAVVVALNKMVSLQKDITQRSVDEMGVLYNRAQSIIFSVTVAGACLIAAIGIFAYRRTREQIKQMHDIALFPYEDPYPVMRINSDGKLLYANPASVIFLKEWKVQVGDLLPNYWRSAVTQAANGELEVEIGARIFLIHVSYFANNDHYNIYCSDITDREHLKRELAYQATHDSLTGLLNRREFESRLATARETSITKGQMHSLLYLDLDQFKIVNDTCGHIAGDAVLKEVAKALLRRTRTADTIARLGGDEFGIILHCCNFDNAVSIANSIKDQISNLNFHWEKRRFDIGASIGVVSIGDNNTATTELLATADSACYLAKEYGRNRVHAATPGDLLAAKRQGEINWVSRLQDAIGKSDFCLYGQRISEINSPGVTTMQEVLIRLVDQDRGIVTPGQFIPAAERYNIMPAIDHWVVETFLSQVLTHEEESSVIYTLNISGQSLCDERFGQFVESTLRKYPCKAKRLCFEITETAAISNLRTAKRFIATMRELGCRFALDDFGNGLSSFGYLKNIEVDYIKIDGLFVKDAIKNKFDRAMIEAVTNVGHEMNMRVIAEFVENTETIECLKEIGVDLVQGHAISKPELIYQKKTHSLLSGYLQ